MKLADRIRARMRLHPAAWRGAEIALLVVGWVLMITLTLDVALPHLRSERTLGVLAAIAATILIAFIALTLIVLLRRGSLRFWWGLLLTTVAMGLAFGPAASPMGLAAMWAVVVLAAIAAGGGFALLRSRGFGWPHAIVAAVGASTLLVLALALLTPGWKQEPPKAAWTTQQSQPLDLPNPGARGTLSVHTLTYGSGSDLHRREYGADVDLKTEAVDGSRLIDGWDGPAGWARSRYWGFDAKSLPRQGRVWFPDGDGPFPLVLMVHGNHDMEDFSDAGYSYLGELFASRGIIAVSVDENFLNSSFADLLGGIRGGLKKENDARAWLLLEHLRLWREWNQAPEHRFHNKIDLHRIALIGHSRGGEAVAIAALFNQLSLYPDDGRVAFDFGFDLRGVIAIAPSDAQYKPRSRPTAIRNVSYLVIQGSKDGDVQSFMGSAQYSRGVFDQCAGCFKAGLYLVGANHGQFNTDWGRNDLGYTWGHLLNLVPIMDAALQRRVAEVMFGAFLEVVLRGRDEYRPFFANPATGIDWFAGDIRFVSQYAAADDTPIANFEEDTDLTTGSAPGVRIAGVELARWNEVEIPLKWEDLDSAAALIAWDRKEGRSVPEYRIDFESPPIAGAQLVLSLAMSDKSPLEDDDAEWKTPDSIDFHIVVTDRSGNSAAVALSTLQPIYAPIEGHTRKIALLDTVDPSEPVFQRYTIGPDQLPGVDVGNLQALALRFDATSAGAIYVDDIGVAARPTPRSDRSERL